MKKIGALILMTLATSCFADEAFESYAEVNSHEYLSAEDKKALRDLLKNEEGKEARGVAPMSYRSGEVVFTHGASRPVIVCAVLELTDVALEAGEIINSVQLGDTARWSIDAAISGSGPLAVQHLIIKPLDSGLKTSLIVTTDRRVYHLSLKSTQRDFMPQVKFVYPGIAVQKFGHLLAQQKEYEKNHTIEGTQVTVDKLSFAYDFSGDKELMPLRVFNDGKHTFIEMPEKLPQGRMPALVILNDSGLFSEDKTSIANYRIQGSRFVVDSLFDKAKLILGEGRGAKEVVIEKKAEA